MKRIVYSLFVATLSLGLTEYIRAGGNTTIVCCNAIGNGASITGTCICNVGGGPGQAARGDAVPFDVTGIQKETLSAAGEIPIPLVGNPVLYQLYFTPNTPDSITKFGKLTSSERVVRIILASFDLQNMNNNPKNLSPAMNKIIHQAQIKNPWANYLIIVIRALPGETVFTEVMETFSDATDLAKLEKLKFINYTNGTVKITIPPTKNRDGKMVPTQSFTIDLTPIRKNV